MAKVKIFLDKGESELDAQHALQKAIEIQTSGQTHDEQNFDDPAMVSTLHRMEDLYTKIYADMIREISDELDKEYSHGGE